MYFQRQGTQFIEYTLANQKEVVVFDAGKKLIIDAPVTSTTRLSFHTGNDN